jgi:hypothetical protein
MALIIVFAMVTSLVQLITADQMRGRVASVYNVAFRGGMPIRSLITSTLVPVSPPCRAWRGGLLLSSLALYFL